MAEASEKQSMPETNNSKTSEPTTVKYDRSIIEGSLARAVWKIAWPTMLTNAFSGLQGIIDHVLVGNFVGGKANAAIGVSVQLWIVVIVFISSIFIGMNVLVARFVGAGDEEKVNRTVYQAFLTAAFLAFVVLAPIGYLAAPYLLDLVNAAPEVQSEALPYLRIMYVFSGGMLIFFMLGGALRSAGDARTPMVLGIVMTLLNLVLSFVLIIGVGPVPAFGTIGSAMGTVIAAGLVAIYSIWKLVSGGWVVSFPQRGYAPDWDVIKKLFKFGLPAGFQGIAMNIGGVAMLAFIGSLAQSAAAQAAYAVAYMQVFSLITWTSMGLMGAAATVAGQNLGARQPDRALKAVHTAARFGLAGATFLGIFFFFFPEKILGLFGLTDPVITSIGTQLLRTLSLSGLFIAMALTYTGGLQGTGDTKSPMYISIISQLVLPLTICFVVQQTVGLEAIHIWLAILAGHFTRFLLSFIRFNQGGWRNIAVDITASPN
ncbi:MATE family efflux transporter [Leptolyngbya sp. 7M]|uniref:MATE family efflux transporter n=1 Tax=Leptolyngbya sp. 7M TaxID=2812896 RepID=UPI001B8D43D2|nr:MATE family efflux transporter [Leptolyngbya sp. 7M]QYO66534.1 MATE family efflux transporter [Leptolyngbya sp. 7M]